MYVNAVLSIPCRCCGEEEAEEIKDVTKTRNGERGAGNGERKSGNELSAETSTKIQNGGPKKRERERRRQRKEFVPWLKSGGDEIANQTPI